jgi:hypothetical protein
MQHLAKKKGRNSDDHRMVERFFELTVWRGMSPEEAGGLIDTTGEGVRRWLRNEWVRLNSDTRKAMREFLRARPREAGADWDDGYRAAVERMEEALERVKASATEPDASIDDDVAAAVDEDRAIDPRGVPRDEGA